MYRYVNERTIITSALCQVALTWMLTSIVLRCCIACLGGTSVHPKFLTVTDNIQIVIDFIAQAWEFPISSETDLALGQLISLRLIALQAHTIYESQA